MSSKQKVVLFHGLPVPGHLNCLRGLADQLKIKHNFRTVFVVVGEANPYVGLTERGHELVELKDEAPYEDYELEDHEKLWQPVDEEQKRKEGKTKVKFTGYRKWSQITLRLPIGPVLEKDDTPKPTVDKPTLAFFIKDVLAADESIREVIERMQPDLIVTSSQMIPPCIVTQKIAPWVRMFTLAPLVLAEPRNPDVHPPGLLGVKLFDKDERKRLQIEEPDKWRELTSRWADIRHTLSQAALVPDDTFDALTGELEKAYQAEVCKSQLVGVSSPYLNLYMYPKELDYDQDEDLFKYPDNFVRYCPLSPSSNVNRANDANTKMWLDRLEKAKRNKKHVVFFSIGTIASADWTLVKRFVEMFEKDQEKLYIICKGPSGDKVSLNEDNMIGSNYIPQPLLLQHADLAIIHGGNNSIFETMFHGVPAIVLPLFYDQLDNAQRIEDLRLGKRLNSQTCNQEQLLRAINDVLADDEMRSRVRNIGHSMRSRDERSYVAELVNRLAVDRHLDLSEINKYKKFL